MFQFELNQKLRMIFLFAKVDFLRHQSIFIETMTSTISDLEHDKIKFYTKVWTPTVPIIASVCFVHGFIEVS